MPPLARALPPATLSLRDFIRRGEVLALFRDFQRALRALPRRSAPREELAARVRAGFAAGKAERDRGAARAMMGDARRQLLFVRTAVGTARQAEVAEPPPRAGGGSSAGADDAAVAHKHEHSHAHAHAHAHAHGHAHAAGAAVPGEGAARRGAEAALAPAVSAPPPPAAASWVGTGDKDDVRGRTGEGWPWGR